MTSCGPRIGGISTLSKESDFIVFFFVVVNLIPWNPVDRIPDLRRPSDQSVDRFADELRDGGLKVTVTVNHDLQMEANRVLRAWILYGSPGSPLFRIPFIFLDRASSLNGFWINPSHPRFMISVACPSML